MSRFLSGTLLAGMIPAAVGAASATSLDGSAPLLCALRAAMECSASAECRPVAPEDVGAPDFFLVDIAGKSVTSQAYPERVSAIQMVGQIDGATVLQGFDDGIEGVRDGLAWSVAIADDSGRFVLSASGDQVAFVVFGACTAAAVSSQ